MNKHNINEEQEQKVNYWKVATIVLFFVAIILVVGMVNSSAQIKNQRTIKIVSVGDFNFSKQEYEQFKNLFNDYLAMDVCNMQETNKSVTCITLVNNQNASSSK